MNKKYAILLALMITILLVTACGSKEEKNAPTGMDTREYILSSFPIPETFNSNSNLTWTVPDDKKSSGNLTIDLITPDVATVNADSMVQEFLNKALEINKDGKVIIEKLDIQIKDTNLITLFMANYVWNGQIFEGNYWSSEGITPSQGTTLDPNLTYPILPVAPVEVPTTYP